MFRRGEVLAPGGAVLAGAPAPGERPGQPNLTGDLDGLLGPGPLFRAALRGYDRLQVDNYVAWAETELVAVRRENDDLLARYGTCSAELEISRRLLACSPAGRELVRTSERVGEILRLAADEAAQLTEAGAADGDRLRAQARAEADLLLRRAAEVKDAALAAARRIDDEARRTREEARQVRAEADARLRAAREEAERIRVEARDERQRLAAQAQAEVSAACAARVAAARAEADDLERRTDEARATLRRLTGQFGDALGTLSALLGGAGAGDRREQPAP